MRANKYAALRCEFVAEDVVIIRLTICCITTPPLSLSTLGALSVWFQLTEYVVNIEGQNSHSRRRPFKVCARS